MDRRRFLTGAVAALPFLSGCLSVPRASVGSGDCPTGTVGAADLSVGTVKGPERGAADPIAIRTREQEDEVEYISDNDTVQISVNAEDSTTGDGAASETVPFEAWARAESLTAGGRAAAREANTSLCTDEVVLHRIRGRPAQPASFLRLTIMLDDRGAVVDGTPISYGRLRHATPTTVMVTYSLEGRTFEMDVPIYTQYRVLSEQAVVDSSNPD